MTANKRIFLNIIATYGRSVLSLVCGLFTARWVLMALGHSDFGLYGVVGGLTIFVSFFNMILSTAISRYYAFSIGEAQKATVEGRADEGLENCRKWFNTALCVHTTVPIMLLIIGYPIGYWMVKNFLTIPPDRIAPCVAVWNCVCISCFVGMVNVPFNAMYVAKQYIAELTLYSVVQTLANFVFFYFMVSNPRDWLVGYGIWMCVVAIVPQIIICLRACKVFPECKFNRTYLFNIDRFKILGNYAFWQIFGCLGGVLRNQGLVVLVNKYFGPSINASMSIANQVSGQTQTLAGAMQGAFQPAIVTAFGKGDVETMRGLAYRACKFALLLTFIFMLPLCVEIEEVLHLWLKNPPPFASGLVLCMFALLLVDKATVGHCLACNASGKIAGYQATGGTMLIASFPLAWLFLANGFNVLSVGWAMVITTACNSLSRTYFARKLAGLSFWYWLGKIMLPVLVSGIVSIIPGLIVMKYLEPSFIRIVITTIAIEIVYLPITWFVALDKNERAYVGEKVKKIISKIGGCHA